MKDTKVLKNKNATLFILEGLAMAMAANMIGPFIQKFTERIGGNNWHVALINSLPPLVAIIFLVPFGIIINKIRNKKLVATVLLLFNSLFFLFMIFIPGLPTNIRATVFVIVVGLMNWPQSLYLTTWQTFYSDTLRGKIASAIYGIRSRYVSLIGVFVVLIMGIIFSQTTTAGAAVEQIYMVIFALCFVFTIVQAILLSKVEIRDRRDTPQKSEGINMGTLKLVLKDRVFMIFCGATFFFYITWQMGWPIFYIYTTSKEFAGFDEFWLGLLNFSISIASFVSYPFWTKKLLKWGTGRVMVIGAAVLVLNPFMYLVSTNSYWIVGINILIGAIIPAFTMALFCRTIELAPDKGKIVYFAVFNTILNVSGFFSPLLGVWIKTNIGIINTLYFLGFARILGICVIIVSVYFSRSKLRHYTRRIKKFLESPGFFGNN